MPWQLNKAIFTSQNFCYNILETWISTAHAKRAITIRQGCRAQRWHKPTHPHARSISREQCDSMDSTLESNGLTQHADKLCGGFEAATLINSAHPVSYLCLALGLLNFQEVWVLEGRCWCKDWPDVIDISSLPPLFIIWISSSVLPGQWIPACS